MARAIPTRRRRVGRAAPLLALAAACVSLRLLALSFVWPAPGARTHLLASRRPGAHPSTAPGRRDLDAAPRALLLRAVAADATLADATVAEDAKAEVDKFQVGDRVQATLNGGWYTATVLSIGADGEYKVKYEAYDKLGTVTGEGIRAPPERIEVQKLIAGQKLQGNVTKIMVYGAFVDVGATSQGLLHASKIVVGALPRVSEVLSVGEQVTVRVSRVRADGALELTMLPLAPVQTAGVVVGQNRTGKVVKRVDYGIFVDIGLERNALIPRALFKDGAEELVYGNEVEVWISQVRKDGSVELSMLKTPPNRDVKLEVGQRLQGSVTKRAPYGIFVDVGLPRNGLVPNRFMVEDVDNILSMGKEIDVYVSRIRANGAFELTMKEPEDKKVSVGDELRGTVKKLVSYGAFVDIGTSVNALVPLSKLLAGGATDPSEVVSPGQDVTVWVSEIKDRGQVELSMVPPGDESNKVPFTVGQHITGATVENVVSYGAFIKAEGWKGLLPNSKIAATDADGMAAPALQPGQEVDVWVNTIKENGMLEFSMYEPQGDGDDLSGFSRPGQEETSLNLEDGTLVRAQWDDGQWYRATVKKGADGEGDKLYWHQYEETLPWSGELVKAIKNGTSLTDLKWGTKLVGKVEKVYPFGAFVDIGAEVLGLVPRVKVAEVDVEDAREVVSVGHEVEVWVSSRKFKTYELELSMVQSKLSQLKKVDLSIYETVAPDKWFTGTVAAINTASASIRVQPLPDQPPRLALVHISELGTEFVQNVEDVLKVGQEVQVRVTGIDSKINRIKLSMVPLEPTSTDAAPSEGPVSYEDDEDEFPF